MSRRMSVSMTLDAVHARIKTATRRHVDTWKNLKAGDRLTLIEKGMGLPKGAKQVVVCEVEIVSVRVEPLHLVDEAEVEREGLAPMTPAEFVRFWLDGHGYRALTAQSDVHAVQCRRIEWRYLDHVEFCPQSKDEPSPTAAFGTHCHCWWEAEPCCWCGSDEGDKGDAEDQP